eukprot:5297793-Amphidinium_carterae.1
MLNRTNVDRFGLDSGALIVIFTGRFIKTRTYQPPISNHEATMMTASQGERSATQVLGRRNFPQRSFLQLQLLSQLVPTPKTRPKHPADLLDLNATDTHPNTKLQQKCGHWNFDKSGDIAGSFS